jgi:hypothetical protein
VPRFSRLRDVVDFVAASLISYYEYANSFSNGSCRHPNSVACDSKREVNKPPVGFLICFSFQSQHTIANRVFPARFSVFALAPFCPFFSILFFYTSIDMARLQTRAQLHAAREASSSPVRSAARRARIVSSVRSGAHRAKSSLAVRVASSREAEPAAEPAEPAADPPSLRRLLCLRCAKRAAVNPASSCFFDKKNSKKCLYCRSQKSKCLPVSTSLPLWLLY